MKTVDLQDKATVVDLVEQAKREPILLREQGGRSFVLIEIEREDADTLALAENVKLHQLLERSRERGRREGWLSTQQVREQLGIK